MFSHETGARVVVHPHNMTGFPEDDGVSASVGMSTEIGISLVCNKIGMSRVCNEIGMSRVCNKIGIPMLCNKIGMSRVCNKIGMAKVWGVQWSNGKHAGLSPPGPGFDSRTGNTTFLQMCCVLSPGI